MAGYVTSQDQEDPRPSEGAMVVWCHPKARTVTTGIVVAVSDDVLRVIWDDNPTHEHPHPRLMWERGWIRTISDQRHTG